MQNTSISPEINSSPWISLSRKFISWVSLFCHYYLSLNDYILITHSFIYSIIILKNFIIFFQWSIIRDSSLFSKVLFYLEFITHKIYRHDPFYFPRFIQSISSFTQQYKFIIISYVTLKLFLFTLFIQPDSRWNI